MTTKGHIEPTKNTLQALNWIKEVLEKLHKDSLNVKDEEYDVALNTLEVLKDRIKTLETHEKSWEFIEDHLTATQWKKLYKHLRDNN